MLKDSIWHYEALALQALPINEHFEVRLHEEPHYEIHVLFHYGQLISMTQFVVGC